jgi:hypothetical protein
VIENQKTTDHDENNNRKRHGQTQFISTGDRKLMGVNVKPEQNGYELMYTRGGKGTFQKSKSISDMESHVFLKANTNQLPIYTYYYTTSDFCLTKYRNFLTQK